VRSSLAVCANDHLSRPRPPCPSWVPQPIWPSRSPSSLPTASKTITGTTFDNVTIDTTGTYGIVIDNITGSATFSNTKVSGTPSGGLSNPTTTFTIDRDPGNAGF